MGRSAVIRNTRRKNRIQTSILDRSMAGRGLLALAVALLVITIWSYWPTLTGLFRDWRADEDYSAGQLVPLVAVFLVWREWKALKQRPLVPCWWAGIAVLLLAQAARMYGLMFMFESAERYSIVLMVAGLVLMVTGWQIFRHTVWILLFLFLMIPLPGKVHNLISGPLQSLATSGSVFLLEALVNNVGRDGNIIKIGEHTLGVIEACSGLRMLTAFIIVAGFIAYMVRRPRWQKAILLASSLPVGVVCNIIRIFATAMLMVFVSEELADKFFHDFAGLVMMPAAVSLMFGELWLMDKLVLPEEGSRQDQSAPRTGSSAEAKVVFTRKRPSST